MKTGSLWNLIYHRLRRRRRERVIEEAARWECSCAGVSLWRRVYSGWNSCY
ncbi:MAG: hypothetical protein V8S95_02250 [Odoribacter sp.]